MRAVMKEEGSLEKAETARCTFMIDDGLIQNRCQGTKTKLHQLCRWISECSSVTVPASHSNIWNLLDRLKKDMAIHRLAILNAPLQRQNV